MQYIISTLLLAGIALAAPEAPPSNGGPYPPSGSNGGPYPPSGWKPSGRLLLLPARQVAQEYAPPATEYGPPPYPSTEAEPETTEAPSIQSNETDAAGFAFQQQKQPGSEHGVYHVLLPDGRLQRVEYSTAPLKAAPFNNPADQQGQDDNNNNNNNYQQEQNNNYNNYQQEQNNNYQQQYQSGKYQQGQFEQQNFPQITQVTFPGAFPQPVFQQPQNNKFQVAQFNQGSNFQSSQYKQTNGNKQEQSNFASSYTQPQNNKYTQNKNLPQTQYPQQPEYEQGASQNQFNKKQFKQQGQSQNKQGATNNFASESSSRFTNANAQQQQQQPQGEVVEYQPIYFAQQSAAQEAPAFTGYVANVQYKDVEPIATPIYSYNPAPLVRILRRTE